jgi:hypothetical protein
MGESVTAKYLEALELLPLAEIARGTGRAYPTLQAYKYGQRRVTSAAARELAGFLRQHAGRFQQAADALDAAVVEEEGNG